MLNIICAVFFAIVGFLVAMSVSEWYEYHSWCMHTKSTQCICMDVLCVCDDLFSNA